MEKVKAEGIITPSPNVVYERIAITYKKENTMKVGTICKLQVDCLGNKAGTLGVVFYDYGDGFQAIFENGNYDGFSTLGERIVGTIGKIEANFFLEEVGFEPSLGGYQFKNVMQVSMDYRKGLFDIAWSEKWQGEAKNDSQISG